MLNFSNRTTSSASVEIFFKNTSFRFAKCCLFISLRANADLTLLNCKLSPSTITFLALKRAGKACAILTCEASSIITMSKISGSNGIYSA